MRFRAGAPASAMSWYPSRITEGCEHAEVIRFREKGDHSHAMYHYTSYLITVRGPANTNTNSRYSQRPQQSARKPVARLLRIGGLGMISRKAESLFQQLVKVQIYSKRLQALLADEDNAPQRLLQNGSRIAGEGTADLAKHRNLHAPHVRCHGIFARLASAFEPVRC